MHDGHVPESPEARRRETVTVLRLAGSIAAYASAQVGNGLSPERARMAVLDAAGELELIAAELRRLAGQRPGEQRAALAAQLAEAGMGRRQIAARLGVSERTVQDYLRRAG